MKMPDVVKIITLLVMFGSPLTIGGSAAQERKGDDSIVVSATDLTSLAQIVMEDDCDSQTEEGNYLLGEITPKPQTTLEKSGTRRSHCGDRCKVLAATKPCYPQGISKIKGTVDVLVVVDESGNVTWARVYRGHPMLVKTTLIREAALRAACKWKFEPAYCSTHVSVNRMISFSFNGE